MLYALFREGEYDTYCLEEIIYIFVGGGLLCYRNIMSEVWGINIWVHVLFISKKSSPAPTNIVRCSKMPSLSRLSERVDSLDGYTK